MKSHAALLLTAAIGALGLAGCSDSGDTLSPDQQPTTADVTQVMQSVVLPMVDGMAEFSPERMSTASAPAVGASTDDDCVDLDDFCFNEDGAARFCSEAPSGPLSMLFSTCERPPGLIDGNWSFALEGFSGTASFDLSIDDLVLSGSVTYGLDGFCWEKSYDQFSAVSPEQSTTIDGSVRYCLGGGRSGQLMVDAISTSSSFLLSLDFDGGSGNGTVVWQDVTYDCTIDMGSGQADCNEP